MQIKDFAEVLSGYTFRDAIREDVHGDIFVLQAKDLIQGEPIIETKSLTRIRFVGRGDAGRIQNNDVVVVARGMKGGAFRSTVFAAEATNVIASSSVIIIRVRTATVSPEYVSHYLNSVVGQDALSMIVSGSYIGALPRSALAVLSIPIPSPQKQDGIIKLFENIQQQQKIFERKKTIQQNILNEAFKNISAA